MEEQEFKKLFRNALEYFHGRDLDDEEMDTLTEETTANMDMEKVNGKWMYTPNMLARLAGHHYIEQRFNRK